MVLLTCSSSDKEDLIPNPISPEVESSDQVAGFRRQFPALEATLDGNPIAYLDGPGGTQIPQLVIDAMQQYLLTSNSNIDGEYHASILTDELIAEARQIAGVFLGCDSACMSFGQNMTTLNFNLIRAFGRTLSAGDEIVTTRLDHDGNVSPWLLMARDRELAVKSVSLTDDLDVSLEDLERKLTPRTKVVAFPLASNAVGTVTQARDIARMAHDVGALAWGDAVAYAPHRRLDVDALDCDVVLCSPYKFFGPHLGLSWMRRDLAEVLPAERVRVASEEPPGHRFETGTLSHEALAGFIAAVHVIADLGDGDDLPQQLDSAYESMIEHERELTEHFLSGIVSVRSADLVGPLTADPLRRVGTFGLKLSGVSTASVAKELGLRGVYTWNGHFYAKGVIDHLGLDPEDGLLRAGVVHYNSLDDVDRFIDELSMIIYSHEGE